MASPINLSKFWQAANRLKGPSWKLYHCRCLLEPWPENSTPQGPNATQKTVRWWDQIILHERYILFNNVPFYTEGTNYTEQQNLTLFFLAHEGKYPILIELNAEFKYVSSFSPSHTDFFVTAKLSVKEMCKCIAVTKEAHFSVFLKEIPSSQSRTQKFSLFFGQFQIPNKVV